MKHKTVRLRWGNVERDLKKAAIFLKDSLFLKSASGKMLDYCTKLAQFSNSCLSPANLKTRPNGCCR